MKLSEHRLTRRVQFYETDAAGIVHFSNYFRYMEEAEHALWRAAGLSIAPAADQHAQYGWPRVAATCDFKRPLRFEEEFEIAIRIAAMSERSIRYTCVLTLRGDVAATMSMTIACVEKHANGYRAVSIPDVMRQCFEVSTDAAAPAS
jgi:acyl-CoA thioester hydrolase